MVNLDDNSRCVAIVRCTGTGRRMLETAGGRCEDVERREPQAKYLEFIAMAESQWLGNKLSKYNNDL